MPLFVYLLSVLWVASGVVDANPIASPNVDLEMGEIESTKVEENAVVESDVKAPAEIDLEGATKLEESNGASYKSNETGYVTECSSDAESVTDLTETPLLGPLMDDGHGHLTAVSVKNITAAPATSDDSVAEVSTTSSSSGDEKTEEIVVESDDASDHAAAPSEPALVDGDEGKDDQGREKKELSPIEESLPLVTNE